MKKSILDAPCVFCGYSGVGYYQSGTHHVLCPWYKVGGLEDRENDLRYVVATLFEERQKTIAQHSNGAEPAEICLCDDCVVESCDMRGEAVECSGHVSDSGKLRASGGERSYSPAQKKDMLCK